MIPTPETLAEPERLERLGEGCYAIAYLQEDGTVLKISRMEDGTMDYIQWCYHRMQHFGAGSPEMSGLAEVEAFGKLSDNRWWAVMPRYDRDRSLFDGFNLSTVRNRLAPVIKMIEATFGENFVNDLHGGNIMCDSRKDNYVITDPSSSVATGVVRNPSIRLMVAIPTGRIKEAEIEETKAQKRRPGARLAGCECNICKFANFRPRMPDTTFDRLVKAQEMRKPFFNVGWKAMDNLMLKVDQLFLDDIKKMGKDFDPIEVRAAAPVVPSKRKYADWKQPLLQRQYHMQRPQV